jgi:hypothetical protein
MPNAFEVGIRHNTVRAVNYRFNPLLKRVELMPKGLKLSDVLFVKPMQVHRNLSQVNPRRPETSATKFAQPIVKGNSNAEAESPIAEISKDEFLNVARRASEETKGLRAPIQFLAPKAQAYDSIVMILGVIPQQRQGMAKSLAFLLDRQVEALTRVNTPAPANQEKSE